MDSQKIGNMIVEIFENKTLTFWVRRVTTFLLWLHWFGIKTTSLETALCVFGGVNLCYFFFFVVGLLCSSGKKEHLKEVTGGSSNINEVMEEELKVDLNAVKNEANQQESEEKKTQESEELLVGKTNVEELHTPKSTSDIEFDSSVEVSSSSSQSGSEESDGDRVEKIQRVWAVIPEEDKARFLEQLQIAQRYEREKQSVNEYCRKLEKEKEEWQIKYFQHLRLIEEEVNICLHLAHGHEMEKKAVDEYCRKLEKEKEEWKKKYSEQTRLMEEEWDKWDEQWKQWDEERNSLIEKLMEASRAAAFCGGSPYNQSYPHFNNGYYHQNQHPHHQYQQHFNQHPYYQYPPQPQYY